MSPRARSKAPARPNSPNRVRCAVYTRKSTDEGLDNGFSSLDAQREACETYIASQKHEGWVCLADRYDDGGFSGGTLDRPALRRLLADVEAGGVDCIAVYKLDRLTRSLVDFVRIVEILDRHQVSFVSITQQFATNTSMGRLTLNMLLSFAQFEREIIAERTRDKMSAARKKGKWVGGNLMLGYDVDPAGGRLLVNETEAEQVRAIFDLYLERQSLAETIRELTRRGISSKRWITRKGAPRGGTPWTKSQLAYLLGNVTYLGKVSYRGALYDGEHEAIVDPAVWERVQGLLRRNGRAGGRATRNRHGALLRGLLWCGSCSTELVHTYTQNGARRFRYYTHRPGQNGCPARSLPAGEVESFVVEQIGRIGKDPALRAEVLERTRTQVPDVDPGELASVLERFKPLWEALSPREQARVLQLLVSRAKYDGQQGTLAITFRSSGIASLTGVRTS